MPDKVEEDIIKTALSVSGVSQPHHLRTRRIGNRYAIDLHVRMNGGLTLREAHDKATLIENKLKERYGAQTYIGIHVEPENEINGEKILITGASGFIGSFLVEGGLEQGMQVWAGVRRTSSRKYLSDPRISFAELDFTDSDLLESQLKAHQKNMEDGITSFTVPELPNVFTGQTLK